MKPAIADWKPIQIEEEIPIPNTEGKIAYRVKVKVPAWQDPTGQVFLDHRARQMFDKVKARHLGLLSSEEIKKLRSDLGLKQSEICELLQLGQKTWSRWENGREHPSRVINVLLRALQDKKINLDYLRELSVQPAELQMVGEEKGKYAATKKVSK